MISDPYTIVLILLIFLLAGMVKGVVGMGLPTLSLALMALLLEVPSAMALVLVPAFVTNLWQALAGENTKMLLRRLWPFLCVAFVSTGIGGVIMTSSDTWLLTGLLGFVLLAYSVTVLSGLRFTIDKRSETKYGIAIGVINGIVTGMTGTFGIPGIQYFHAIGLGKDQLVQAMGILFLISSTGMGISLFQNSFLSLQLGTMSMIALVPAMAGMIAGQKIRARIPEPLFRRAFLMVLLLIGLYLVVSAAYKGGWWG